MKIISIVGARPQFIKLAPLSREIRKNHEEIIVHTGQHYDNEMSDLFFKQLKIPEPDYNLGVGSGNQGWQTGEMIKKIENILIREKPEVVILFGDTNSTLAGAIAASKLKLKIAHVEAGLRSFNKKMPEEINRIITDHISDILFCPTKTSVNNLKKENITNNVYLVGDIMLDALLQNIKIAEKKSNILSKLDIIEQDYLLATVHRQSNTDNPQNLRGIINAFIKSKKNILFTAHPRTKKSLEKYNLINKINNSKIQLINPVSYLDMLILEKNAKKILTDSGGVQKEAYIFKTPCITLRDETEWIETTKNNANLLIGVKTSNILQAINTNVNSSYKNVFGDGKSSEKIVKILSSL